jgi:threonine aldolase
LPVVVENVETNFVQLDVGVGGLTVDDAIARLEVAGVGLSSTRLPGVVRAVTHLDVTDDDVERAIELIPAALGALVRV